MKIFFIFFLFTLTLLQAENDVVPTKEKLIFLKNNSSFRGAHTNQILPVSAEIIIADDNFDSISSEFKDTGYGIEIITKNLTWHLLEENTFLLTYYIKVKDEQFKIPDILTSVIKENSVVDSLIITGKELNSKRVQKNNRFCNVVAKKIIVKNHKISKYNEEFNILALELESTMGNLENFSLPFAKEDGIDWINIELPTTKIFYYGIIPNTIKTIEFNYYNPGTEEFSKVQFALDFSKFSEKTSTQIEINPNKQKFPYLKIAIISFLTIVLLILFLKKRKYFYFAAAILTVLFFIYLSKGDTIMIKNKTNIYLLPTENSSVFYTTSSTLEAEVIKKESEYYKVLLPDDKIGWVKESDIVKN
ncbi:MAG: hypothetical protein QG567_469 [Campylobacterota bacterium]|nr:hypothetical protein [Campylobacterota bacterium]